MGQQRRYRPAKGVTLDRKVVGEVKALASASGRSFSRQIDFDLSTFFLLLDLNLIEKSSLRMVRREIAKREDRFWEGEDT